MKIETTININVEKKGKNLIVRELGTLTLIMGSAGVSGNYDLYGIKKERGCWIVSIQTVKERIKFLEHKIVKQQRYLEIMKQVVK